MQVEEELAQLSPEKDMLLAIGVFDGVHLGHKYLISRLKKHARERDLLDMHPELVLDPDELAFRTLKEAEGDMGEYIPHLFDTKDPYALLRPSLVAYREVRRIISEIPEDILRQFLQSPHRYGYPQLCLAGAYCSQLRLHRCP